MEYIRREELDQHPRLFLKAMFLELRLLCPVRAFHLHRGAQQISHMLIPPRPGRLRRQDTAFSPTLDPRPIYLQAVAATIVIAVQALDHSVLE